jgi:transcriptional antiterminator NusG
MEKHWNVIYVSSRTEKRVSERLSEKGIDHYLPLKKTVKQWSDRKKIVELPLFTGYVFVNISQREQINVLETPGVVNFVKLEKKIAIVRVQEMEAMRSLIELGYDITLLGEQKQFNLGDRMKIENGPLKGLEGKVIDMGSDSYFVVFIESIQNGFKVKVPKKFFNHIVT